MFDHIFENRDKKVTNIIKLSDYLGRSLRENVEVFSIDDTERKVTFITESGKIIAGTYNLGDKLSLTNIQVENDELFENNDKFDDFVNYKISNFIQNIFEEDFVEADTSFNKVLQLWENRVKFSSVKKKLYEKSQKFNGTNRILESAEFQKLVEIAPQLVSFLKENESLVNIPEIKNMIRLSSSVSKAFNVPKLSYEELKEGYYSIPDTVNHTIYEMVCKQELVRKELVESKNNFNLVWLNNEKISKLASLVYEDDETVVAKALVEAVCEVPYLALATKKQITETIVNNLELNDSIKVNLREIKAFTSQIFEFKKPLKRLFVSMLNEKYGISVQNLKDIPTFRSLLNTQVLIFEALAKLSPKGSVQKEVLSEAATMFKTKNGVEAIDVNRFIELLFEKAEYKDILSKETLIDELSIKETFSEIESIEELINLILETTKKNPKKKKKKEKEEGPEETTKEDAEEETESLRKNPQQTVPQKDETQLEDAPRVDEKDKAATAVEEPEAEVKEPEAKVKEPEDEEEKEKGKTEVPSSDEIMASFKNFEDILNSINFEDLEGEKEEEEEEEEADEKEAEVDKKEEGEE